MTWTTLLSRSCPMWNRSKSGKYYVCRLLCMDDRKLLYSIQKCSAVSSPFHLSAKHMSSGPNNDASSPPVSQRSPITVAFVGLGNMGHHMARNLLLQSSRDAQNPENNDEINDGIRLIAYDAHEPSIAKFMESSEIRHLADSNLVSSTNDLKSLAKLNPDFVITSLPKCEASEEVVSEIVQNLTLPPKNEDTGCIFIDTSTISPSISKKLNQLVTSISPHNDYVDAPVSGGVKGASDATLTFMVGCSSQRTMSSINPILQKMGKKMIPCGTSGSGSAVKLCNNLALSAQMLGVCEAMNLGEKLGVDPTVLAGVMNVSTAKCWSSEVNNPHPEAARAIGSGASANDYEGGFGAALMLKDLNLAVDAAEEQGVVMPVGGLTRDLYRIADLHGYGKKDFGVLLPFLKGGHV